jgi:monooxygenase
MDPAAPPPEHFDVLVIGAGLSGVGAGYHLQSNLPGKTYAILEAREAIGGTWDQFRYPGIRSDSDMYTLCFPFRPWTSDQSIVDGGAILQYVRDTAREFGIDRHVRFRHRVIHADWSPAEQRWTVEVERGKDAETATYTCSFLFACAGYYRYDQGYTPAFAGLENFGGRVVHPQFWPEGVNYDGKRVVVIGSGATAVTLVPALAETAAHVTMLQRSPSYVLSMPSDDALARKAQQLLPAGRAYSLIRWKNALLMMLTFQLARRRPELAKRLIRRGLERALPPGYDIDRHFTPRYGPWKQRLCLVRDADLFEAIGDGRASIVTDEIESFTEAGIRLASGGELDADLVVTATGLNLLLLGGMGISIDGRELDLARTVIYRGCMLSEIPSFAFAFGYTNASWTLRCDLTSQYVCRLLSHMQQHGYSSCVPRNGDPSLRTEPFADFSSGYILRSIEQFPKQGSKAPWRLHQNYLLDTLMLRTRPIDEPALQFVRNGSSAGSPGIDPALVTAAA